MCDVEPVGGNYGVLWLLIMECNSEPVVVNHGLLCCAKGYELWQVMLCQLL